MAAGGNRHDGHASMTANETTTCINCGAESEYNRRVERIDTRTVVGGLCASCETARFGDALQSLGRSASSGCVYCDTAPTYVLPEHVVSLDDGGAIECEVEGFFVTETTPRLCRSHLDVMRPETATFWPEPASTVGVGD